MEITYDPAKRALTLEDRGIDFANAAEVFRGLTLTIEDDRFDYGEVRYQTIGLLNRLVVMVVWTSRGAARHIISMRMCNVKERKAYQGQVDRSR
jgi:uncharacterized DUF497 family protein